MPHRAAKRAPWRRVDTRAVPVPEAVAAGLPALVARTLGLSSRQEGARVLAGLVGTAPTYGQLAGLTLGDVREAARRALRDLPPAADLRDLATLLGAVDPGTAVCPSCGELGLNALGGKVSVAPPGLLCPFCGAGRVVRPRLLLRRVAWTTGALVDPTVTADWGTGVAGAAVGGASTGPVPLQDDGPQGLRAWAGGVDARLDEALREAHVPLYGFLGWLRHGPLQAFGDVLDAARVLREPARVGLVSRADLRGAAAASGAWLAAREITNAARPAYFPDGVRRAELVAAALDGRPLLLERRVGRGDKADVYLGRWDAEPSERLVVKVLRAGEDADLLEREAASLRRLGKSQAQGAELFGRLVPSLARDGVLEVPGDAAWERARRLAPGRWRALAVRAAPGFDWTLADVRAAYPQGVPVEAAVWMLHRLLPLLDWVHRSWLVHGAVLPRHVLIHPRDHAARLLDWGYAVREGQPLPAVPRACRAYYPRDVLAGAPVTRALDVRLAARTVLAVAGGDPAAGRAPQHGPTAYPRAIARALEELATSGRLDGQASPSALDAYRAFRAVATDTLGPPRYHVFEMPPAGRR